MSGDPLTKNISRVRTFKDDMAVSRTQQHTQNDVVVAPESIGTIHTVTKEVTTQENQTLVQPTPTDTYQKKYLTLSEELTEVAKPHKKSILSDEDNKSESDIHTSGTIIRDTKRKRFRLFPAMVSATASWVTGVKEEYESATHPQSRPVAKAEARTEVIQKAILHSEQAPKEDFKKVSQHLKTVERKPVTATLSFKDKRDVPAPSWSYVEDETIENTTTYNEEQETPEIAHQTLLQAPQDIPTTETSTDSLQATQVEVSSLSKLTQPEVLDFVAVPAHTPESGPLNEQEVLHVQEPTFRQPVVSPKDMRVEKSYSNEQSSFPITLLIIVIIGASLLGVSASFYFFGTNTKSHEKVLVYKIPSLLHTETQVPLPLPTDRTSLLTALGEETINTQNVTQIYPTVQDETGTQKPAPAEFIFEVLAPKASGSFIRSIKEATFGGVAGEPFIVLKTTSFDVGFAGMLAWEEMISADLSPLFGMPVTETFDPSARTNTQVRSAFFKDTIASNKNVRLLLDENGKDRMVYTFINQNTIVITTTRQTLDVLIPLIQ